MAKEELKPFYARAILNPGMGLVVLGFDVLRRLWGHEKGGYCKELEGGCDALNCPEIMR